jgi:hypothetical protein
MNGAVLTVFIFFGAPVLVVLVCGMIDAKVRNRGRATMEDKTDER